MYRYLLLSALLPFAAANAAGSTVLMHGGWTGYGDGLGERHVTGIDVLGTRPHGGWRLGIARGERRSSAGHAAGSRLESGWQQRWGDRLTSHSRMQWGGNSPVFPVLVLEQTLSFRVGGAHEGRVGVSQSRHRNGVVSSAVHGEARLRGTRWETRLRHLRNWQRGVRAGTSHATRMVLLWRDAGGTGSSSLWLTAGNSLAEDDGVIGPRNGRLRSATLLRAQPVGEHWTLRAALGRSWNQAGERGYIADALALSAAYRW